MSNYSKVLYLSCYPSSVFTEFIINGIVISQAAQKFNRLVVEGFCHNGFDVDVIVFNSVNSSIFSVFQERVNERTITYYPIEIKGNRVYRTILRKAKIKKFVRQWRKRNKNGIAVIDALQPGALELSIICRKSGIHVCSIITDFVDLLNEKRKHILDRLLYAYRTKRFYKQFNYTDLFVLLTERMQDKLNIGQRRVVIMEGLCDYSLIKAGSKAHLRSNEHVFSNEIVYTGIISKQFGLDNLVNGFIDAKLNGAQLCLYGSGDYVEELIEICKIHPQIEYHQPIPNEEVLKVQRKARFLVNPRPVSDEYTQYSFPSKTVEYMTSGRPVITTKLPCITSEYYPYLFFFSDDTREGICSSLIKLYSLNEEVILTKGTKAKLFVEKEKNNYIQIRKIVDELASI